MKDALCNKTHEKHAKNDRKRSENIPEIGAHFMLEISSASGGKPDAGQNQHKSVQMIDVQLFAEEENR